MTEAEQHAILGKMVAERKALRVELTCIGSRLEDVRIALGLAVQAVSEPLSKTNPISIQRSEDDDHWVLIVPGERAFGSIDMRKAGEWKLPDIQQIAELIERRRQIRARLQEIERAID